MAIVDEPFCYVETYETHSTRHKKLHKRHSIVCKNSLISFSMTNFINIKRRRGSTSEIDYRSSVWFGLPVKIEDWRYG
jgi:hypothetical protein